MQNKNLDLIQSFRQAKREELNTLFSGNYVVYKKYEIISSYFGQNSEEAKKAFEAYTTSCRMYYDSGCG